MSSQFSSANTKKALTSSIFNSLKKLNGDKYDETLLLKLISSLRYLDSSDSKYFSGLKLDDIDIFNNLYHRNLNLLAILFAYCSILPFLQPLIINSLIVPNSPLLSFQQFYNGASPGYTPGFYTIVQVIEQFQGVDLMTIDFLNLSLDSILIKIWIPQWLLYLKNNRPQSLDDYKESLTNLVTVESNMDFFIATSSSLEFHKSKYQYFIERFAQRIILLPQRLISQTTYNNALSLIVSSFDINLENNLRVLMEIIDHPEYDYIEQPRLCILLYLSLNNIQTIPIHILHKELNKMGTVQSLSAIVNMCQFLLARYLLKLVNGNLSLPKWFDEHILPPIPPISKSLFVFDNDNKIHLPFGQIVTLLIKCLNLTILINTNILLQYKQLQINPLENPEGTSDINYQLTRDYLELYFIPEITSLLLSDELSQNTNQSKISLIYNKLLFINSIIVIENLIFVNGGSENIIIYHLIKFVSRISIENLYLQKISINLLNHLFFHSKDTSIIKLCEENELSLQSLKAYIELWNDGTSKYSGFYEQVFQLNQPPVELMTVNLNSIIEMYLPDDKHDFISIEDNQTKTMQMRNSSVVSSSTNKFDPYITKSFVPNYNNLFNNSESFNSSYRDHASTSTSAATTSHTTNLWNSFQNTSQNKIVNTGKNYILGGHNRVKNNSRVQSIHIDQFENFSNNI
ncbi:hypothetical protein KAFR_0F03640 [Kazachstania africana CBS 2517]|uniref:Uncharacterized protein n=1 Tax=Kazachstania africana (strain ATCC 22294 / BCRC 22015 / CBS 2517 / CECT 1963 / NBRC 1671 / NRRL Y-8276) TaxID=1071382 RepID=H2AX60_KAZAF|nr:hypothetical protein KAFR_0F03640 [Kazachstania africana CBS 2517]CCF58960.1 hypothetical protein KAFR_0F03640 [Kazachstania africana CBS 2517]